MGNTRISEKMQVIRTEEICPGLVKRVYREGSGECPPLASDVSVHYVGTLASNGSKFDSSRDRGEPFEFKIGQEQVIKGWDKGVATMKIGELAQLECAAEVAYGVHGSPPKIPGGATLHFEVELLDFTDGSITNVTTDGKVRKKIVREGSNYDQPSWGSVMTVTITARQASITKHFRASLHTRFSHTRFFICAYFTNA